MRFGGKPSLSAAQQLLHLRSSEIYPGTGSVVRGRLTWRMSRRPFPLAREYEVRLVYQEGVAPQLFVDRPDLVLLAEGDKLPHVYSQRPTRLCLYWPKAREWSSADRVDLTFLPWMDTWLYYFEDWMAGGRKEWQGGGEHPDPSETSSREDRRLLRRFT